MSQRPKDSDRPARILTHPTARTGSPPPVVAEVERLARRHLEACLREFLNAADDDLFDRADRTGSGPGQHDFYEAMRALRLARRELADEFFAELQRGFRLQDDADSAQAPAHSDAGRDDSLESRIEGLSLVDHDDLEERVAIDTMIARIEEVQPLLQHLITRRMRHVMDLPETDSIDHPVAPRRLGACFARGLTATAVSQATRILLYKLFERQLAAHAERLYVAVNRLLVDQGVLPTLRLRRDGRGYEYIDEGSSAEARSESGGPPSPDASRSPRDAAGSPPTALGDRLPGLAARRRFATPATPANDAGGSHDLIPLEELLHLVDRSAARAGGAGLRAIDLDHPPGPADLAALLTENARAQGVDQPRLQAADEDVINLMQMLFEFVLSDRQLPAPMKALIGRMQLTLLRVALADRDFFRRSGHPARKLLNRLVEASFSWTRAAEAQRDRLYAEIERIVNRMIEGFDGEISLFETLDAELVEIIEQDRRRTERASQRAIEREHARIEADRTRRMIQQLLEHRCSKIHGQTLTGFLRGDWQQVLLRRYRLDGPRSESWREALAALRSLTGGDGMGVSELHRVLMEGLESLGHESERASREATDVIELLADETFAAAPASTTDAQQAAREQAAARGTGEPGQGLPDKRFVEQATAMEAGTWVEIRNDDTAPVRCRLASVTEPPERCIFLNRRGLRIQTLSRTELAQALATGRMVVLDDGKLFERALASVVNELRTAAG